VTDLVVQAFILIFLATYPVPIVPILAGTGMFALMYRRKRQNLETAVVLSIVFTVALYAAIMSIAGRWGRVSPWGI
jgi:hypothetical protein